MSRENNRKKEEASGSGWGSKLLIAAGAGALGFLASQLYSEYKDEFAHQSTSQEGGRHGNSNSQRSQWEDIEGNNSPRTRKENREKIGDNDNVPECLMCVVCLVNPRNIVQQPCNHMCLCENCADKVDHCPVCRAKIQRKSFVYIP